MTDFTLIFNLLDTSGNGYISYDEFMSKIVSHIDDTEGDGQSSKSDTSLDYFVSALNPDENGRIYLNDFLKAIENVSYEEKKKLENWSRSNSLRDDEDKSENIFNRTISVERKEKGIKNKRLIKYFQSSTNENKADINLSNANDPFDYFHDGCSDASFSSHKGSYSNLTQESAKSRCLKARRQSDVVMPTQTTNKNRSVFSNNENHDSNCLGQNNNPNINYETVSCHSYSQYGGSAANLYYIDSMSDMQMQLQKLEKSLDNLNTITTDDKSILRNRKKTNDNKSLLSQIQVLEDRIKEQKIRFEKELWQEKENFRRKIKKIEHLKSDELSNVNAKFRKKETEIDNLQRELSQKISECERLKYDKLRMEDKMADIQHQRTYLDNEMKQQKELHKREMDLLKREYSKEGDSAQKLHAVADQRPADDVINQLRQENHRLRLQIDELESQLLAFSVKHGKDILSSMMGRNENEASFMTELDSYTKEEVIDLLVKEKDGNFRLRDYINGILTRVIEKDPTLLEIS